MGTCIAVIFIYYYAQIYIHATLSETLGLTLGLSSFVLLWNGWLQRNHLVFNAGMASLAVALSARAGPNFMAPALFVLVFLDPFSHSRFKDVFWSILSFTVPFMIMMKLSTLFGDPASPGAAYSNFGSTIYGLVNGGKSWVYAYQAPSIQNLIAGKTEAQEAKILYEESWNVFKGNPFNTFLGMINYLGGFLYWFIRRFSFGAGMIKGITTLLSIVFWFLIGFRVYAKRLFFHREFLFLTIISLGIAASSCITWKDGGIRPFAVAIPFIGALFGFAFASSSYLKEQKNLENIWAICLVGFIVLSSTLNPYIPFRTKAPDISALKTDQVPGQKTFLTHNLHKQPHIIINNAPGFHFRTLSPDQIKTQKHIYEDSPLGGNLETAVNQYKNNFVILYVYDYISPSNQMIVAEKQILDTKSEWVTMNGNLIDKDIKIIYHINRFRELP